MADTLPDIDRVAMMERGKAADIAMPMVEQEVAKFREGVFREVFRKIQAAKLTPDEALHYWQEIYAYHRLLKTFQQAINMGQTAAASIGRSETP